MPLEVRVQAVQYEDFAPAVVFTGEIRAKVQTDLSFRVSGRVDERYVDVGSHVTPDQVLASIDPTEQQTDIASAMASVDAAQAQLHQAQSSFERQQYLLDKGITARAIFDQAVEAQRTAQSALDSAQAQLDTARDALSFTKLKAGVSGIITARQMEVGRAVQAAQSVFTLAQDGPRDAVFEVFESLFFKEFADGAFDLALVSDPAVTAKGRIREVAPAISAQTGTVRVKVAIEDAPLGMTLGSAVIGITRHKPRPAVIVPWSALATTDNKPAVWVIDPTTNKGTLKPIVIDEYANRSIIIGSGLTPGDLVVTEGTKMLRPDEIVIIIPQAKP